jgi:hypothetical protein
VHETSTLTMESVRLFEKLVRHVGRTAQPHTKKATKKRLKGENYSCVIAGVTCCTFRVFLERPCGQVKGRAVIFLG